MNDLPTDITALLPNKKINTSPRGCSQSGDPTVVLVFCTEILIQNKQVLIIAYFAFSVYASLWTNSS